VCKMDSRDHSDHKPRSGFVAPSDRPPFPGAPPATSSRTRQELNRFMEQRDKERFTGPPATSSATRQELNRLKEEMKTGGGASGSARGSESRALPTSWATRLELNRLKEEMERRAAAAGAASASGTRAEMERRLRFLEEQRRADSRVREREIRTLVLKAQELDIAFLVDSTGSMGVGMRS
jgi:hypothetical protein